MCSSRTCARVESSRETNETFWHGSFGSGDALAGPPDVLVVLDPPPEELLARANFRARPGEEAYDLAFFRSLESSYAAWASRWRQSPVIHVDVARRDLRRADEVAALACDVLRALGS